MLFSSPAFFLFFAVYFVLHISIPSRYRIYLIILGSTVFYAWWKLDYVWLPYALMATAYLGGLWIDRSTDPDARRRRTIISIVVLFIPLVVFKYTDFIYRDVLGPFTGKSGNLLDLPLPLGVSFVTFTLTAYIVEVYNQRFPANRPALTILAYVLFFPHLIAGPILRPDELVPQLENSQQRTLRRFAIPIAIFTLGLVKKLIFADQIGLVVDEAFEHGTPTGPQALLAIIGFAVQIYCDFSGYTDMAIGLAALLQIRLPINFNRPYTATSISGLWRRWHMTLTRFLSDYIYTPISLALTRRALQRRAGKWPTFMMAIALPVTFTFLIAGIWHGAGWNFVLFGLLTGLAMSVEFAWRRAKMPDIPDVAAWFLTMLTFLLTISIFRSRTLEQAAQVLAAPVTGGWGDIETFLSRHIFPILLVIVFALTHRFDDHRYLKAVMRKARPELCWVAIVLCWVLAITISQGSSAKFVYFDF